MRRGGQTATVPLFVGASRPGHDPVSSTALARQRLIVYDALLLRKRREPHDYSTFAGRD